MRPPFWIQSGCPIDLLGFANVSRMYLKAFVPGGKLHEINTFEKEVDSMKIRIVVSDGAEQQL